MLIYVTKYYMQVVINSFQKKKTNFFIVVCKPLTLLTHAQFFIEKAIHLTEKNVRNAFLERKHVWNIFKSFWQILQF